MDIFGHLILGGLIKTGIEKASRTPLDTPRFLLGSVLPDLRPDVTFNIVKGRTEKVMHYREASFELILSEIKAGQRLKNPQDPALDLGRYTHYFSDYFCHPHTRAFKGNPLTHLLYELGLTLYLIRNYRSVKEALLKATPPPLGSIEAIKIHFELEQLAYFKEPPSYRRDIAFALGFGLTLGNSLIHQKKSATLHRAA